VVQIAEIASIGHFFRKIISRSAHKLFLWHVFCLFFRGSFLKKTIVKNALLIPLVLFLAKTTAGIAFAEKTAEHLSCQHFSAFQKRQPLWLFSRQR